MAHPPELRQRAKELRKQGLWIKVIAIELGVPKTTVTRWLNPDLEKRDRIRARKLKYSQKQKCSLCKTRRVSNGRTLCQRCFNASRRVWTAEKVVAAIQAWAVKHGRQPVSEDWSRSGSDHPAISSILGGPNPPFKSWGEALTAAGFEVGKHRRRKPLPEELKRVRADMRRKIREDKILKALEKENSMTVADQTELERVLDLRRAELHAIAGVVGSGIGLAGDADVAVIQVFVEVQDFVYPVQSLAGDLFGDLPLQVIVSNVPDA